MALKITDDCTACGVCVDECPNSAISEGDDIFVINPDLCTECVGFYDSPQCQEVCPVDAIIADPAHQESQEELLENMQKLNIEPSMVDDVFISHNHFDHTGGLSAFLHENNNVNIYLPSSFRCVHGAKQIVHNDQPEKLHENVYTTGELEHIEQSMAISTPKGIVLVVGCSHPKMKHILDTALQFGSIYGIIGGLHGFNEYELFENLELICPTHCTQHIQEIKHLYPDKYVEGGVGKVIEI